MLKRNKWYLILLIHTVIIVNCQYDDAPADLDYLIADERPMPSELSSNKTNYEVEMENCMRDYVNCYRTLGLFSKKNSLCAVNQFNSLQKDFDNICDMVYESCKGGLQKTGEMKWKFLHDGTCEVSDLRLMPSRP